MKLQLKFTACILMVWIFVFVSCEKEYSYELCADKNKLPVALAGPDQVITLPIDSVLLDGNASSDPDGRISEWLWKKISGPASFIINNSSAAKTVAKNLAEGIYLFELKVTDNGGFYAEDTVQIIVNNSMQSNRPPVANAGTDQLITLPINTVNLDGSGSTDPDNNIASYSWAKIEGPSTFDIAYKTDVQTPVTNLVPGIFQFELKVTDAGGLSSKDTLLVYVRERLSGLEIIYDGIWGCNDLCRDGDVYWDSSPWRDSHYSDPNVPLEVLVRLDTSFVWNDVRKIDSPLPPINQFYWKIERGFLWVFAYEDRLIGTKVTVKVNFL